MILEKANEGFGKLMGFQEAVAKCWCAKSRVNFGLVLTEDVSGSWFVQHSFACSQQYVDRRGEEQQVAGGLSISDRYNGCKFCLNRGLAKCNNCNQYSCCAENTDENPTFECGHCGARGVLSGYAESINISGD